MKLAKHGKVVIELGSFALSLASNTSDYVPVGRYPFALGLAAPGNLHEVRRHAREAAERLRTSKDTDQWANPWPDPAGQLYACYEGQRFKRRAGRDPREPASYPAHALFEREVDQPGPSYLGLFMENKIRASTKPSPRVISNTDPKNLDAVLYLIDEARTWLRDKDTDQWASPWPSRAARDARVLAGLKKGKTWIVWDGDRPAATVTIATQANPAVWSKPACTCDLSERAVYAHRLITARNYSGWGLGAELIDWAGLRSRRDYGAKWVRIDVWSTNKALHGYYRNRGFEPCGTCADPFAGRTRPIARETADDAPAGLDRRFHSRWRCLHRDAGGVNGSVAVSRHQLGETGRRVLSGSARTARSCR
jgi:GNAT superfamily N-acetyltransferase